MQSPSVRYLRRSNQLQDLAFNLDHFDDVDSAFQMSTRKSSARRSLRHADYGRLFSPS
jgi:hypothetical protein